MTDEGNGGGKGSPDDARGGDTQPPTGSSDSNTPELRQDIDYGGWINPNPGPVVN
ncbi:hypothetical protein ACFV2Z_22500 [Streptomyces sp. NPDC059688]|uniref:hypothetical protein n=1 Tax=Streptomyces sp. NPDC059688 TaxID=3346906 RepID=UPI0036832C67